MESIRIKIKKRDGRYTAYPEGLEDKIVVHGASREEALENAKAAIDAYLMAEEEKAVAKGAKKIDHPTHIVAVMGIVRNSEGKILLVQSPRRGWEPPGGQVENGEDVMTALKREIFEESGIEVEIGRLVAMYSNVSSVPTKLMLTFEAKFIAGRLRASAESVDVSWFSPEDALAKVTHEAQKQKLQDALQNGDGTIYRVYGTAPYKLIDTRMV